MGKAPGKFCSANRLLTFPIIFIQKVSLFPASLRHSNCSYGLPNFARDFRDERGEGRRCSQCTSPGSGGGLLFAVRNRPLRRERQRSPACGELLTGLLYCPEDLSRRAKAPSCYIFFALQILV